MSSYVQLALPIPVFKVFTYSVPAEHASRSLLGIRALVPFGQSIPSRRGAASLAHSLRELYDLGLLCLLPGLYCILRLGDNFEAHGSYTFRDGEVCDRAERDPEVCRRVLIDKDGRYWIVGRFNQRLLTNISVKPLR